MPSNPQLILHVEDEDQDAALIAHLLRGYGFSLERARTYGDMLAFQGEPDVVLLDLRIPGSNDPIRLVRDAVRRFRTAGIILLTGVSDHEGEEISVMAMAAGAQARLVKGTFDKRRLWISIREVYHQRQHMLRAIEESRSDMVINERSLESAIRTVLDAELQNLMGPIREGNNKLLRRLRQLGAEDTSPVTPIPIEEGDADAQANADPKMIGSVLNFIHRHAKVLRWISGWVAAAVVAGYLAVSDYVTGIRDAVFETRDIVRQIDEKTK